MINGQQLKTVPFSTRLFRNCYKAYPFSSPNSTSYLMLPNEQAYPDLYDQNTTRFISPAISNQTQDCCYIVLEGECLNDYILSKKNDTTNLIMTQEQIWALIICMCGAFSILKEHNCAEKLTHFKQYSIRRLEQKKLFKLIFHQSMISQLDTAKSGVCQWHQLYMSPEQLTNKFVPEKSIVFSFGVLLLNVCSNLDSGRTIYRHDKFQVDFDIIRQKIQIAKQNYGYSKLLCNFIEQCLLMKYDQRFDFAQLKDFLERKLQRNYLKQSELLNQIKDLEQDQSKIFSYQIWLPPNYRARETFKYQNLVKNNIQRTKSEKNASINQIDLEISSQKKKLQKSSAEPDTLNQKQKSNSIKKKSSIKKFEVPKIKKQSQQKIPQPSKIQSPERSKNHKDQTYLFQNIEYRGTFGQRNILPFQEVHKNEDTVKRIKKIKEDDQNGNDEQIHKSETIKKESNNLQVDPKVVASKYQIPSLKMQQVQNSVQNPLMLQITCNNGIHNVKEHYCNVQEADTPKGFGKFSFNKDVCQQNTIRPQQIQQSTVQYTQYESSPPQNTKSKEYQLPQLITKMKVLILQFCLRPIEQLISTIGKIGVWVEGDLYYGEFLNGRRNGLALQIFANGEYYFGFFKQDLFSGEGFYFWNSRQYYFGHFQLGQKIWGRLEGEVQYQGGFKDNKRHGQGTCWYSTGQVYSGEWLKGKRHGHGVVIDPQGSKFVGNWIKGKRKGEGCLQTDCMRIAGNWNDEIIEGQSFIQYSNGDVFRGKTGKTLQKVNGQYISKTGRIFKGQFESDQPRKGQLIYSNGDKYIGELYNMKRNGYGEYYYKSGDVYKGLWENNVQKQ